MVLVLVPVLAPVLVLVMVLVLVLALVLVLVLILVLLVFLLVLGLVLVRVLVLVLVLVLVQPETPGRLRSRTSNTESETPPPGLPPNNNTTSEHIQRRLSKSDFPNQSESHLKQCTATSKTTSHFPKQYTLPRQKQNTEKKPTSKTKSPHSRKNTKPHKKRGARALCHERALLHVRTMCVMCHPQQKQRTTHIVGSCWLRAPF